MEEKIFWNSVDIFFRLDFVENSAEKKPQKALKKPKYSEIHPRFKIWHFDGVPQKG